MPVTLCHLRIEGLCVLQPKIFGDPRGYFLETYNEKEFAALGVATRFVQDNQSKSTRGVLRGLHYQKEKPQAKLVRVIEGEVFDVAVDLRKNSVTFGEWEGVLLTGELQNQFFIPPGFAHGFLVLSSQAVFAYKCSEFYNPMDEAGILWNDSTLGIAWPQTIEPPRLSAKDLSLPMFDPTGLYF